MAVLVDAPRWAAYGTTWAHLVSDTSLDELHAFAERAGVPRRAFDLDHYDVPAERHAELVALGAEPVSAREMVVRLAASGLRVSGRDRERARRADLAARWAVLVPGADAVGEELLRRWSEPHRTYHGTAHLADCLRSVQVAAEGLGTVPRTVLLALWFHDAVHDGEAVRDEERSAQLARDLLAPLVGAPSRSGGASGPGSLGQGVLGRGAPDEGASGPVVSDEGASGPRRTPDAHTSPLTPADVDEVARLVLLTTRHDPAPGDVAGALVSDADLAVLAGSPTTYRRYVRRVRAEYAHVDDAAWRVGRAEVLRSLLVTEHLFATPVGRDRWESRARANLAGEIEALTTP
ncbi:DUF4031 domain-containing protein [Flavimobilis sp. GY10621]|uniref:DUF4031 domain-containing protein n=1 Tax=Flavimobilis rhizosphaerae TaxID=2775421 RepID=A0ABR9DTI7_9MICO|nr:DUF4031 domain-containing protein [Flavimobilis rhizosphaerae]MBD9700445.1 DUF4031 domain-containing protein [Flavimobilis rhizosphaerae]